MTVEKQLINTINKYSLIRNGDRVLIGLSGGADSVCLTYLLHKYSSKLGIKIVALHINHNLRGAESLRDEKFALDFAKQLAIDFVLQSVHIDKGKKSVEMAAREARYKIFDNIAQEKNCNKIATAHHKDDLVETVLLRLFKGSGVDGLIGIPIKRNNIIRPLLHITRSDIEEYLNSIGLTFVTDSTNLLSNCERNIVRNDIVPIVTAEFPKFQQKIADLSIIANDEEIIWENLLEDINFEYNKEQLQIEKSIFNDRLPIAIIRRFLRKIIQNYFQPDFKINISFIEHICSFAKENNGNKVLFENNNFRVVSSYNKFIIERPTKNFPNIPKYVKLIANKNIMFGEHTIYFSKEKQANTPYNCKFNANGVNEIFICRRQAGDHIKIHSKNAIISKKIKDFFIDKKFDLHQREMSFVLRTDNKQIIAVFVPNFGFRVSVDFYVNDKTTNIKYINIG